MKRLIFAAAAFAALSVPQVSAATLPFGVQNDVAVSTVTGWGWTQIYRDTYGAPGCCSSTDGIAVSSMFAGHGNYVIIGGIAHGSSTIDVMAAVSWADFITYTPIDTTHAANGALWYNNGFSLGFAGLGDVIQQSSADVAGPGERDRLSWHTTDPLGAQDPSVLAANIWGGWRSGDNLGLNDSADWDRIIFTADVIGETPLPAALPLLASGLGFLGFAGWRKRRRAMAA